MLLTARKLCTPHVLLYPFGHKAMPIANVKFPRVVPHNGVLNSKQAKPFAFC
jgi:hypothetical protein